MIEKGELYRSNDNLLKKVKLDCDKIFELEGKSRNELNEQIENINKKYQDIKKKIELNVKEIKNKLNNKQENNEDEDDLKSEENEYKILYETSLRKIKSLNDINIKLRNDIHLEHEKLLENNKKNEIEAKEIEKKYRLDMIELNNKNKVDINDLELKLKCIENEYGEYKNNMESKISINENNKNLLIEKLKRENDALSNELNGIRQTQRTLTPNSRILSPCNIINNKNNNYNDYSKHIRESPLMERTQNELLKISNIKDLENNNLNLKEEIESYKKQLFGKKELIKEFEDILKKNQIENKNVIQKINEYKKIIDLYEVLTSTKIEKDGKEKNGFLCRTVNKKRDAMLEYNLSFFNDNDGVNNDNNKDLFCDYKLLSSRNIKNNDKNICLNEDNIQFNMNQAPLWLKGLLQQMFVN